MKLKFLNTFTLFTAAVVALAPVVSTAQDKEQDAPDTEPEEEEPAEPFDSKGFQERMKQEAEAEKEVVNKMMKVFGSLEGSWTGRERLYYEQDRLPEKNWKDEWEGKYTFGGRYFEMTGKTEGEDMNSAYKWICTYDTAQQKYRAWYFGDTGQNEYTGELSQDGTFVKWAIQGAAGGASRFTMKADGPNRVKCHGTDTLADGSLFSTQSSEYTRKRVEL